MAQYLPIDIERSHQLVLHPEANPPPCLGCHFFAPDKEANGFEREHLAWDCPLCPIRRNSLFCCVVADAVELCLPAELNKLNVVVLMCLYVQVIGCEGKISAVDEDILEIV